MNMFLISIFLFKIAIQLTNCQFSTSTFSQTSILNKSLHNEFCNNNDDCDNRTLLTCINNKCKCPVRNIWSENFQSCVPFQVVKCNDTIQCQDQDKNTICLEDECRCQIGLKTDSKGFCNVKQKYFIGSSCDNDTQCQGQLGINYFSFCYQNQCTCSMFYEEANNKTECKDIKCHKTYDCRFKNTSDPNAYCDDEFKCKCPGNGYHLDYTRCKEDWAPLLRTFWIIVITIIVLIGLCILACFCGWCYCVIEIFRRCLGVDRN